MEQNNKIIVFENKSIRRAWHDEQWYFSIIDVIEVLTDSVSPSHYWSMLKKRENELVTICYKLKMEV
jgi:DNA-damage-inducible protein D